MEIGGGTARGAPRGKKPPARASKEGANSLLRTDAEGAACIADGAKVFCPLNVGNFELLPYHRWPTFWAHVTISPMQSEHSLS